ncbi:hypothetical protein BGZ51_003007 [Haplosporangium sp. Z 767]|nr:hypothetical protein BGZ51_003007 [Haplosporangium sp. Z 767]
MVQIVCKPMERSMGMQGLDHGATAAAPYIIRACLGSPDSQALSLRVLVPAVPRVDARAASHASAPMEGPSGWGETTPVLAGLPLQQPLSWVRELLLQRKADCVPASTPAPRKLTSLGLPPDPSTEASGMGIGRVHQVGQVGQVGRASGSLVPLDYNHGPLPWTVVAKVLKLFFAEAGCG